MYTLIYIICSFIYSYLKQSNSSIRGILSSYNYNKNEEINIYCSNRYILQEAILYSLEIYVDSINYVQKSLYEGVLTIERNDCSAQTAPSVDLTCNTSQITIFICRTYCNSFQIYQIKHYQEEINNTFYLIYSKI